MLIRLKGRLSLLLLAFVVTLSVATLVAGLSVMAEAQEAASPTISSDQADYPPGGTVILTGSGWQPGESVNISVNDDVGRSWSRNVDVTADESGQIRDEFQLPGWFVAQYSVKATGAQSGVATTSFTDAAVTIEGKSICGSGSSGSCSPDYNKGPLTGWKERDKVPMRLKFDDTGTYTVSVRFDHATTSGTRIPGFEDLKDWTADTGVNPNSVSVTLDQSTISQPIWAYTVTVQVTSASPSSPAFLNFNAIPDAGSHNYPGKSLQIRTSATRGTENAGNDVIGVETPGALPGNPDLLVTKTGPQSATPGQEITYTLSYQNKTTATDAATGVRLTDVLPFNLNGPGENDPDRGYFVGCSGTPTCTITGTTSNTVIWELGVLAKGAGGSRTLTVKVPQNASHGTQFSNLGQILSAENDATPGDNQSTWTTTISFNRAPTAVDDPSPTTAYSVDEDQTLTVPDGSTDVLVNDSDPDGDLLNAVLVNGASNGQVTLNQNGSFEYNPAANFHGSDSFTYKARDGSLDSNTATVRITVNAANDDPVAVNDNYELNEDTELTITANDGVLKNDTDVDNQGNTNAGLTVKDAQPVSGPSHGQLTLNADGSFTYTPDEDFFGTDSFSYKASDGTAESNTATVSINVKAVNDAPVADNQTGDSALTTLEDTSKAITLSASDAENQQLTYKITSLPAHGKLYDGTVDPNHQVSQGASLSGDQVTYVPEENYNNLPNGNPDSFEFVANDGSLDSSAARVEIKVSPVNDAPSFTRGDDQTVNEDSGSHSVANWATAISAGPDDESTQSVSFVVNNDNNNLFSSQPEVSSDGTLSYTPAENAFGVAEVSVEAKDTGGTDNGGVDTSDPQSFTITVNPVNDAPVLDLNGGDETGLDYDEATFTEDEGAVGIVDTSSPGGLSVSDVDDENMESATATLTNHPDGTAESLSVDTGTSSIDTEGYNATTGVLHLEGEATKAAYEQVLRTVKYNNSSQDPSTADRVVEFVVNDGDLDSARPNSTVAVISVNDAPEANSQQLTIDEGTSELITLTATDPDNDPLTYKITSLPAHGKLYKGDSTDAADEIESDDLPFELIGNQVTYKPDLNYNNTSASADTFKFVANDRTADSNEATVSITVRPVNDAPVANDDDYSVNEDSPLNVGTPGVLDNDSDIDSANLTAFLVTGAAHGSLTLNADGSFTYTPHPNYNGPDSFTYKASDDSLESNVVTVSITVEPVNDAPVANDDDAGTTPEDTPITIPAAALLANDSAGAPNEEDNQTLTIKEVFDLDQGHGHAVLNSNGSVTFTPDANYHGEASFDYTVCDSGTPQKCYDGTATVRVMVSAANDAPVAEDGSLTTNEDTTQGVTLSASDVDGDTLTYTIVSGPTHGTLNGTGANLTYTPAANYYGADSFTFKVNDGTVDSNVATVRITVNAVNDAPVAVDDLGSTGEAAAVSNSYISQYASRASTPTRLYQLDTAQRPYAFTKVGADILRHINAIGYRSTDGSLYGYRLTGKLGIMKVNPNTGAALYLGNPRGLPASNRYITGDVSPDGSTYYLYANKSGVLRAVNLTTFSTTSVKLSSVINVADLAVSPTDGNLYGVAKDGRLLRVDPETGQVTPRSVAGLKPGTYGAAWFTAEGDLIAYENGRSRAYGTMTWIAQPTTAPSVVSQQAGPSTVGNDGAAYVAPPDPAGLSVVVDVLANDGGPDGVLDRNTLRIVQPPANGTVSINADKTITYTSGSSYRGTDSFRYEVCDSGTPQLCSTATVNITSAPVTSSTSPTTTRKE